MTSRDWQADRRAVFGRDDHTCRHCGAVGDAADPTALRTHPVGAVPLEGTVHESALVTVCDDCFAILQGSASGPSSAGHASVSAESAEPPASHADLFDRVRETTRTQGGTIADVASFASLATSLPTRLGDTDADEGPTDDVSTDDESADETASEYRRARREVLLAVDVADAHLERLAATDGTAFDADVHSSLEAFSESSAGLQSTLRTVVELAETVPAGLERCHGCFEPLEEGESSEGGASSEGRSCSTCGLAVRETADWRREDGDLAFDRLFAAINDELQAASTTTETLTDRATTLAAQLSDN